MQERPYEINAVLLVKYKDQEVVARVAGYESYIDTFIYINLRVSDGLRWGERRHKIMPEQIIKPLPDWEKERQAAWEAELKAHCDERWAKMSEAQKQLVHEQAVALGLGRERRSPLDILIDRATGRE